MKSYHTAELLREALYEPLHPAVRAAVEDTFKLGLEGMTHLVVIEPGDSEFTIRDEIGFHPSDDMIGDIIENRHADGLIERVYTVGNDGFAYIVFMEAAR